MCSIIVILHVQVLYMYCYEPVIENTRFVMMLQGQELVPDIKDLFSSSYGLSCYYVVCVWVSVL